MDAETGFLIDGKLHPFPTRDTFDNDEWQLMYDLAALTLEDFLFMDDEEEDEQVQAARHERFRNPAVWRALMQIAYQRENPTVSPAKAKALIGKVNMLEALSGMFPDDEEEADAADPPASPSEPENSLQTGSLGTEHSTRPQSASSTESSTNDSSEQESQPVATGRTRLVTSST